MNALRALADAGLTLRTDGDRLIVTPASVLTDSLRSLIREHKLELLTVLRSTPAPHPDGQAATPAGARDRAGANALMTIEQADRCHVGGWNDGGRRQLSCPIDDNYPGRFEAGEVLLVSWIP